MKNKWIACIIVTVFALIAAGCGNAGGKEAAAEAKEITVTDMTGREVTLQLPIATYAISTYDVIDFIVPLKGEEAFQMLVGVGNSGGKDAYDAIYNAMFPDLAERVGIISEHNAPFDMEMILAKQPDVLIVNSAMQAHTYALEIESQLAEAGIPLVLIDVPQNITASSQEAVALLGQIFSAEERAKETTDFISAQFDVVAAKDLSHRTDRPSVYYEKSGTAEDFGPTSLSASSGWGAVVAFVGGDNIADAVLQDQAGQGGKKGPSLVLDPEYVIDADPDFIFLSGTHSLGLNADVSLRENAKFDIVNRAGWSDLAAVEKGNLYEFQHELSRTVFSFYPCLAMAKILYPGEFEDVDPEAILAEFYENFMLIDSSQGIWILQFQG